MRLLNLDPNRDHLQTMIMDDVLNHLKSEPDKEKALGIALLLQSIFSTLKTILWPVILLRKCSRTSSRL